MSTSADRQIMHIDLDTFFVSVERLMDSRLCGRPVLLGGTGSRGVVASCSYEARAFGVHSGMSIRVAQRCCPHGIVVRGDSSKYAYYSGVVTEIIKERLSADRPDYIAQWVTRIEGMAEDAARDRQYSAAAGLISILGKWLSLDPNPPQRR